MKVLEPVLPWRRVHCCVFFFDCTRLRKLIHKTRSCKKHELVSTSSLSPRILFNETMMIGEFVFNEDCIKSI